MPSMEAGHAWVDRFLIPLVQARMARSPLSCVHLFAPNDHEAAQLRLRGHECVAVSLPTEVDAFNGAARAPLVITDPRQLPLGDGCADFVFSGELARVVRGASARNASVREIRRVLRPGGAALIGASNRWCPVDLENRRSPLHGPGRPTTAGYHELRRAFFDAGFAAVEPVGVKGHFGLARLPAAVRPFGRLVELTLHLLSASPVLYASPINPWLMFWVTR